jgi:hypothetical protein
MEISKREFEKLFYGCKVEYFWNNVLARYTIDEGHIPLLESCKEHLYGKQFKFSNIELPKDPERLFRIYELYEAYLKGELRIK